MLDTLAPTPLVASACASAFPAPVLATQAGTLDLHARVGQDAAALWPSHPSVVLAQSVNAPPVVMIGLGILGLALIIGLAIGLIVPVARAVGWIVRRIGSFIGGEIGDLFRLIGAVFTALVFVPITLVNVLIGRWSAAGHYGRSIQNELGSAVACLYRMLIGHPARLVGLEGMLEGIEERVPQAVAAAPGPDRPSRRTGQFDGYSIVGSLQGGGSGGKLYIAQPDAIRRASFERAGHFGVGQVVIKSFSLRDGSSLPQIVRESRALEAAKKLGLVLDHEMTNERFFYVMRYVPGQSLSLVMQGLHSASPSSGLTPAGVRSAMTYASDLLKTLDTYHRGGLWHKDVKPDNIIVDGEHAHLVDFGLLTHLSSSMTLTTHGTEYFRDPELVRMALRGVKVHEVDGAKFDIYAAGAVIYAMIENSFPAHGALSQITRTCPEALRWIVRRAMTEYDKRYATAAQMLLDLETVRGAADPFAVTPAMLPSMRAGLNAEESSVPVDPFIGQAAGVGGGAAAAAGIGAAGAAYAAAAATAEVAFNGFGVGSAAPGSVRGGAGVRAGSPTPRLRVVNWWTGKYESDAVPQAPVPPAQPAAAWPPPPPPPPVQEAVRPKPGERAPAHEQVRRARERAQAARQRVQNRMHRRLAPNTGDVAGPNRGVMIAVALLVGIVAYSYFQASESDRRGITVARDYSYAIGSVGELPGPADPRVTDEEDARREHAAELAARAREAAIAEAEAERDALEAEAEQLRDGLDRLRDQKERVEEVRDQARQSAESADVEARAAHAAAIQGYQTAIEQIDSKLEELQSELQEIERERDSIDSTARAKVAELEALEEARIAASRASREMVKAYPGKPRSESETGFENFERDFAEGFKNFDNDFAKGFADAQSEMNAAMKEGFGKSFADAFGGSPRGRLALYVDLGKPFSQEQTAVITKLVDRLLAAGFTITGDFPTIPGTDDPAHAAAAARSVQVSAELLRARAAYGIDSKEARTAISRWLAKDGTLDAAILLYPAQQPTLPSAGQQPGAAHEYPRLIKDFAFVVVAPETSSLTPERREQVSDVVKASVKALSGKQVR